MQLLPRDRELGWTRYVWLVYLVPVFFHPVMSGSGRDWAIAAGSAALLVPLYFLGYWCTGRRLLAVIAGITLLGILTAPLNSGAAGYFIYAASFVGRLGRPRVGVRYLLAILSILLLEAWLVGFPYRSWIWAAAFTLIVGGINIHFSDAARRQAKLKLAHDEVERLATMAERERIARDLHDVLGHTLSLITIKAGLAARLAEEDPARTRREVEEIEEIARSALGDVRRTVSGYRYLSLGAEVARAKVALAAAGIDTEVRPSPFDLDAERESALALALREGVTNVVRHSGAESCRIGFRQADGRFELEIVDDGRGGDSPEGNGLAGMRERIAALGGTVMRDGSRGTRLGIEVPLDPATPRREAIGS